VTIDRYRAQDVLLALLGILALLLKSRLARFGGVNRMPPNSSLQRARPLPVSKQCSPIATVPPRSSDRGSAAEREV
jgi:hypothetical protein